jgi:ankyrin repeat protein
MSHNPLAEWEEKIREAASKGNYQYIKQIAEWYQEATGKRFNFSAADELGRTALHLAACAGHLSVCRLLLQYGADTTLHDKRGNTALHLYV